MTTSNATNPQNINEQSIDEQYDPKGLDDYDYNQEASPIRRLLWFCAGVDKQVMQRCPHSERVKAEGMGGIVLATAMLAFASSSYAFYIVFGPKVGYALSAVQQHMDIGSIVTAILCGLIWALVIFNLDRFIVTSTGHGDGKSSITGAEFGNAIPRLAMAAVIGITLSAPLEVRVFQSEIEAELQTQQRAAEEDAMKKSDKLAYKQQNSYEEKKAENIAKIKDIHVQIVAGREKIKTLEQQKIEAQTHLDQEATTGNGHGKRGIGPIYKALQHSLKNISAQLEHEQAQWTLKETALNQEIAQLEQETDGYRLRYEQKRKMVTQEAASIDGLGKRIELAHQLFPWPSFALMALLMIIEMTPVIIKMMLIRGPYDRLVDNQNKIVQAKFAIEETLTPITDEKGKNRQHIGETFHQAETVLDFERGKLQVEAELAHAAQAAFEQSVRQEIQAHPEKYIADSSTSASS